ncbi:MAG TPA: indole-3-glycerol-phosphate synthase [Candidatus Marinimicrobia bacterium]|nr:indole-3-glycerol-phosphate synthase [Candidatus Neomarinimicrobiota bacterium]
MNILDKILDAKRQEIQNHPNTGVPEKREHVRSLKDALFNSGISVIAEIKMKSPSEGNILPNANPVQIAKDYESAGATAISVLTDEQFFGGSLEILKSVRDSVSIPVLRKDFIISNHQIMEAANVKADAYLLIAEALNSDKIENLLAFGDELGLEALVEFHNPENAEIVAKLAPPIVGVNCRDLKTMTTDIAFFEKMVSILPPDSIKVAESGIYTSDDLKYVSDLGYNAALVGTSLMKTGNPGKALENLLGGLA